MPENLREVLLGSAAEPFKAVHLVRGRSETTLCGVTIDKHTWANARGLANGQWYLSHVKPDDCRACIRIVQESGQSFEPVQPERSAGDATGVLTEPIKRQLKSKQREHTELLQAFVEHVWGRDRNVTLLESDVEEFMKASWKGFYFPPEER